METDTKPTKSESPLYIFFLQRGFLVSLQLWASGKMAPNPGFFCDAITTTHEFRVTLETLKNARIQSQTESSKFFSADMSVIRSISSSLSSNRTPTVKCARENLPGTRCPAAQRSLRCVTSASRALIDERFFGCRTRHARTCSGSSSLVLH